MLLIRLAQCVAVFCACRLPGRCLRADSDCQVSYSSCRRSSHSRTCCACCRTECDPEIAAEIGRPLFTNGIAPQYLSRWGYSLCTSAQLILGVCVLCACSNADLSVFSPRGPEEEFLAAMIGACSVASLDPLRAHGLTCVSGAAADGHKKSSQESSTLLVDWMRKSRGGVEALETFAVGGCSLSSWNCLLALCF